ncbi:MAG: hypothetical protein KME50_32570 [Nostoc desertorum CM1-VF14]|jgi:hypothetical protein|nr:hypothetical protein [Nostoc desertorum CM1-VF14]
MPQEINGFAEAALSVTHCENQTSSAQAQLESDIVLHKELNITDNVQHVPFTEKSVKDVSDWTERHRETTRTKLVMWLMKLLGCSLVGTFVLTGVVAFSPKADKELIKNLIPQLVTTQVTLLGVAFGFYFGNKEE